MEQINVLIVEDDPFIAIAISDLLEEHHFNVVNIVNNAEDAWKICKLNKPDVIILDITLKSDLKGTWVGNNILKHNLDTKIIYLTSHSDLDTINEISDTNPVLYVTKPYKESVLIANINMAVKKTQKTIEIVDNRQLHILPINKILYIQSEGNYLNIHLHESSKLVVRKKITDLLESLPEKVFLRIHQSYLINTHWIDHADLYKVIVHGNEIPVSRSYKPIVKNHFKIKA